MLQRSLSPIFFVNALLLAAAASIALVLVVVCIILGFYQHEPMIADSMPKLLRHTAIFLGMTVISGGAFFATRRYRGEKLGISTWTAAQLLLIGGLVGTTWYYLPS